ncbi:TAP-like protein-domain-containing protein [Abortiporus biennis]|nr:TAP-like protein-domain-containing protein [Abortiporus biennis]
MESKMQEKRAQARRSPVFTTFLSTRQRMVITLGLCILFTYGISAVYISSPYATGTRKPHLFSQSPSRSFYTTEPIGTVKWWKCDGSDNLPSAQCGYIIVPKDYFNSSAGTVKIALGKLPATATNRQGSVLFNPGGPGGSGKSAVIQRLGLLLQNLIGDEHDIIGFDPRGIGETEPRTQCFEQDFDYTDFTHNTILERGYDISSNLSASEFHSIVIRQQIEADALLQTQVALCAQRMGDELRYMGTSTVVRDVEFITKTLEGEDALINFYGGSYGSILGQYLVNMLPDRVGRVVIDGIADAVAWSSKPPHLWYHQWLSSTETAYNIFVTECSAVGPDGCPLAESQNEEPSQIKDRINRFIDSLYYHPLPIPDLGAPKILTAGRLSNILLARLQRPVLWPSFAKGLAQAMQKNDPALLFQLPSEELCNNWNQYDIQHGLSNEALDIMPMHLRSIFTKYSRSEHLPHELTLHSSTASPFRGDLERLAVSCNDQRIFSPPPAEEVIDALTEVYRNVSNLAFAVVATEADAGCGYWNQAISPPPEKFSGPWNHTLRNPLLVVSNMADPVTPISSGKLVVDLLGNSSRLLVQNSPGHCSLALPSLCTSSYLRSYFINGTLPPEGTVCEVDVSPFPDPASADSEKMLSPEEEWRLAALRRLSESFSML